MSLNFKELDFQSTPIGDLLLRRRRMPQFPDLDIYEIKLGEEFLMTSLFHESEEQLAKLTLATLNKDNIHVVVGGLGLGYTTAAALEDSRVKSVTVVEFLKAIIGWHESGLVPLGKGLTEDKRCQFIHGDFFAFSRDTARGFDPCMPNQKYDAILLDIDHTPNHILHPTNSRFYSETGLAELATHLAAEGVFGLWSDGAPEQSFVDRLGKVFSNAEGHLIEFDNPITGGVSRGTVYLAKKMS